ncbi:hypothetical protein BN874_460114 [Candidatus Contendobacter odensis Run_B_J11]|uniref:Uncharacterized protein n=1 Tax=Candidatus Contendobacter odensis Run_B_J11 TaxID=1400861 RepID=A0A7U7J5I6_9GAMM|nr:hypothetical protein BN874_460114 [Candidatus Contendobacter odensis Run_B_J11]
MTVGFNPCCIGLVIATAYGPVYLTVAAGFNPCCIGLVIATPRGMTYTPTELGFQSLLYWISHCDRIAAPRPYRGIPPFQSLLYWISHCDRDTRL